MGLSVNYYLRQFFFGVAISGLYYLYLSNGLKVSEQSLLSPEIIFFFLFIIVNAFLYPYARFIYESCVEFILGENSFNINAAILLTFKLVTMVICWAFSIFIAPVGLLFLYFYHSKMEKQSG